MENQEIPKYTVMEKSLIGNEIHEAGAVVAYDGLPADNLKPTCALGEKRRQEYIESNKARVAAMQSQYTESAVGDPIKFMADFAKAQEEATAKQAEQIGAAVATAVVQAMAAFFPNGVPTAQAPAAPVETATATSEPKVGKGKDKAGEGLV